jgi:hypothetical protein
MKTIVFFLSLFIAVSCFSQNDEAYVNQLTNEFATNLQERGITHFFSTKHYCSGTIEMFMIDGEMCTSKETYYEVYIFWQEDGRSLMKKIDNCGLFRTVLLSNDSVFKFVATNLEELKVNEVKEYKSSTESDGPELSAPVEPCFRDFTFWNDEERFEKSFNLFHLTNKFEGDNLNFDYNQSLAIVRLNSKVKAFISAAGFQRQ